MFLKKKTDYMLAKVLFTIYAYEFFKKNFYNFFFKEQLDNNSKHGNT
jgi:hypothetical protein